MGKIWNRGRQLWNIATSIDFAWSSLQWLMPNVYQAVSAAVIAILMGIVSFLSEFSPPVIFLFSLGAAVLTLWLLNGITWRRSAQQFPALGEAKNRRMAQTGQAAKPGKSAALKIKSLFYRDQKHKAGVLGISEGIKRTYYLVIENDGPDDLAQVSVSVSKVLRHPKNPNDETRVRLENLQSGHFYPLPFGPNKKQADFPPHHKDEIEFISYDSEEPQSIVIGGSSGTLFYHEGRILTLTVQAVAMGQQPVPQDYDVWVENEELKVWPK